MNPADLLPWWDQQDNASRAQFLRVLGVHAFYFSPLRDCCLANLEQMLKDVTDVFNTHDLHYWVDFGALLGIIRSGELIAYDKDIDIGIFESDIDQYNGLRKDLQKRGYIAAEISRKNLQTTNNYVPRIHLSPRMKHCHTIVACDLFVWQNLPKTPPRKAVMLNTPKFIYCDASYYEDREWLTWKDKRLAIPKNPQSYLALRYGPKWKLADPLFYRTSENGSA